jgi:trk system potassium uptake protein TrkH
MGFAALILVGAVLLSLPWAHQSGHSLGWLDALFLSTSATCVTGLTTVNVAETFNGFGQAVLLVLIQAGGLGIFTGSILLVLASGNRLSLADEQTIYATVGRLRQARPLAGTIPIEKVSTVWRAWVYAKNSCSRASPGGAPNGAPEP